jgi:hypothetical protein
VSCRRRTFRSHDRIFQGGSAKSAYPERAAAHASEGEGGAAGGFAAASSAEACGASRGGGVAYLAKCARATAKTTLDGGGLAKRPRPDDKPRARPRPPVGRLECCIPITSRRPFVLHKGIVDGGPFAVSAFEGFRVVVRVIPNGTSDPEKCPRPSARHQINPKTSPNCAMIMIAHAATAPKTDLKVAPLSSFSRSCFAAL